jgi:hypothetical protein
VEFEAIPRPVLNNPTVETTEAVSGTGGQALVITSCPRIVSATNPSRKTAIETLRVGLRSGNTDYHIAKRDGQPAVESTWESTDEMDPRTGRRKPSPAVACR